MNKKRTDSRHIFINTATIIFLLIIIYLLVHSIIFLKKDTLASYEVNQSDILDTFTATGVISRKESVFKVPESGYVNYYMANGSRVSVNGIVYTLDQTGKAKSYLSKLSKEKSFITAEEKAKIVDQLKNFSEGYNDRNFAVTYDIKKEMNNCLLEQKDTLLADYKKELKKICGDGYKEVKSDVSGIISYSSDELEGVDMENINPANFSNKKKMRGLRTGEKMEAGDEVYRIVSDQTWRIILLVDASKYERLKRLQDQKISNIQITIQKDNFTTKVPFECVEKEDNYYIVLTLKNYVQRYIDQRYLDVSVLLTETEGLKVPTSSLVTNMAYKVPSILFKRESDETETSTVTVRKTNQKGKTSLGQVTVKKYPVYIEKENGNREKDTEYIYIVSDELSAGDVLLNEKQTLEFGLEEANEISGVYDIDKGYTIFKSVYILSRTEDYCIIDEACSEIGLFEHIILNSHNVQESQVIY